jgi:hypothetical protein
VRDAHAREQALEVAPEGVEVGGVVRVAYVQARRDVEDLGRSAQRLRHGRLHEHDGESPLARCGAGDIQQDLPRGQAVDLDGMLGDHLHARPSPPVVERPVGPMRLRGARRDAGEDLEAGRAGRIARQRAHPNHRAAAGVAQLQIVIEGIDQHRLAVAVRPRHRRRAPRDALDVRGTALCVRERLDPPPRQEIPVRVSRGGVVDLVSVARPREALRGERAGRQRRAPAERDDGDA